MKNIIVYGSRFGQFYLEALKRMKGIKIVGLLAKGNAVVKQVTMLESN